LVALYGSVIKPLVSPLTPVITPSVVKGKKGKGKSSSLDIAPLTILDSGALQPWKWQLTGIDCSTTAQASGNP